MNEVRVSLAAGSLLLHLVLGCCWHHAQHWCLTELADGIPLSAGAMAADDVFSSHSCDDCCRHSHSPHCSGSACGFTSEPVRYGQPARLALDLPLSAMAADDMLLGARCRLEFEPLDAARGALPVRPHLFYQVMLL